MSTFIDPSTIRRLADAGDAFYKGAAWILDQQDAANDPISREVWHRAQMATPLARRPNLEADPTDYDNTWSPVANAADLGAPRVP